MNVITTIINILHVMGNIVKTASFSQIVLILYFEIYNICFVEAERIIVQAVRTTTKGRHY